MNIARLGNIPGSIMQKTTYLSFTGINRFFGAYFKNPNFTRAILNVPLWMLYVALLGQDRLFNSKNTTF